MQRHSITNRFDSFKEDFKKDTGFDWSEHKDLYISYFQSRVQDQTAQVLNIQLGEILNDLTLIKRFLDPASKM